MSLFIPVDQWLAVTPEVFSDVGGRSPEQYVKCIEQFHVDVHPRYKRNAQGYTMCNIFAADVLGYAMKAPCPHWVDATTQAPLPIGPNALPIQQKNRAELSGNGICKWLQTVGVSTYGWKVCTPAQACVEASKGNPTTVTWLNPTGIGHIGVIRPSTFPNIRLAQAGGSNFVDGSIGNGFGSDPKRMAQLVYLSHA